MAAASYLFMEGETTDSGTYKVINLNEKLRG